MNISDQIQKLSADARHFYDHHTRNGSVYELVQRRDEIRTGLVNGTIAGRDRKAAVLAFAALQEKISPPPTGDELTKNAQKDFIQVASRLLNAGDYAGAEQVMKSAGLSVESLPAQRPHGDLKEREAKADKQYRIERDQAISKLQLGRGISKRAATEVFHGREPVKVKVKLHPDAPKPRKLQTSMADELMKKCNRMHALHVDRKIM